MTGSGLKPSIGAFGCVLLLGLSASRAVAVIAGVTAAHRSNRTRVEGITPLIKNADNAAETRPSIRRIERIELDGVSFHYLGSPAPCIDGVNLSFARGEELAYTGPSGSG